MTLQWLQLPKIVQLARSNALITKTPSAHRDKIVWRLKFHTGITSHISSISSDQRPASKATCEVKGFQTELDSRVVYHSTMKKISWGDCLAVTIKHIIPGLCALFEVKAMLEPLTLVDQRNKREAHQNGYAMLWSWWWILVWPHAFIY